MAAETMKRLADNLAEALGWLRDSFSRLSFRHDTAPIATVERLFEFASTRAALIAQKKLYGYLKERMGTIAPGLQVERAPWNLRLYTGSADLAGQLPRREEHRVAQFLRCQPACACAPNQILPGISLQVRFGFGSFGGLLPRR